MFRIRCALVMLVVAALPACADDISLIRITETWKLFRGYSEPSVPLEAWRQVDYNDANWPAAVAGFSHGYHNGDEATVLYDMYGVYTSIYCRKQFTVSDPALIRWLVLRVDYDSGFVAYLNGQEVARRGFTGLPGDPVPYNAVASPRNRGQPEEIDLSGYLGLLTAGANVLALQAHSSGRYDYYFALMPELLANFTRGPFIQNTTSNQTQVIWKTPVFATTVVEYGPTAALGLAVTNASLDTNHVLTLPNLLPGTRYYYRVSSGDGSVTAVSPVASFRTLKPSGDICFTVYGDDGSGNIHQYQVAKLLGETDPDLVLHTGDIIYMEFTLGRADLRCLSVHGPNMRSIPYFLTYGNHDLYDYYYSGTYDPRQADRDFLTTFYLPTNSVTGTAHYYSFDHGDAHFVSLFVPYLGQYTNFPNYTLTNGSPQYRWLTNDLAQSTKPWKFLFFHQPVRTSALHRNDDSNYNRIPDWLEVQQVLMPVAQRYGVQVIFNGHDHDYERFNPVNGVYSVVTGGGGFTLYGVTVLDQASAQFFQDFHCVYVALTNDTLSLQAIATNGLVFDTMTIQRAAPPQQTYYSTGHTPNFAVSQDDYDGDGNYIGQTFDFTGRPILTFTGQFSNLGRVWVNNDGANLYIGFDQVMLNANNNLFLFVGSDRAAGVENLAGLGNGVVDPAGEGADGLDFLNNLSFLNFRPVIGCILGDEYADSQFRSYLPGSLGWDTGQGAFWLDPGLNDVPGVQIQQFNCSPQVFNPAIHQSVTLEQNANFIMVSIPLSCLGNPSPGEYVKLGAVVAGPQVDTGQQIRELDTSFLGYSLTGSGLSPVSLAGVSVQLASDPDPDADGLTTDVELALGLNPLNPDTDGDGLRDGWEVARGLNPLSNVGPDGADGDPDGDGASNNQEQLAGTNPRDPASALRLTLTPLDAYQVLISWQTTLGHWYILDYADDKPANFQPVASDQFPLRAVSAEASFIDLLLPPAPAARYYRVRLVH